ncbi:MAG: hypothetical protein ABSH35_16870 [Isosphaeraceae bacterium]|jgi:hypothetical protein
MATAAQIEANRRNAQKSTGPKTDEGKDRVRRNALKHGMAALTIMPVLPQEDPEELEDKTQQAITAIKPRDPLEHDLVCRAVRLSWALDRAERAETAHLAHRVRMAERSGPETVSARELKKVHELGSKLFFKAGIGPGYSSATADDYPAVIVCRLEESAEGCRWLLARWAELLNVLDCKAAWGDPEIIRFVGLLGKRGIEAHFDPELNSLFHAFDALGNRIGHKFWKDRRDGLPLGYIGGFQFVPYREIAPPPSDKTAALILICSVIERHVGRLEKLLAEHEEIAADESDERYDRAALDCSPAFERHRRYQSARHRELMRNLEALRRMRNAECGMRNGEAEKADGKCRMADGKCQMAEDEWQMANAECQMAEGELQAAEGELQLAGGELKMGDEQCEVEASGCDEGQSSEPMTEGSSGPVVGHDSNRVIDDSTNDKNGILSREGAHAAGQPGQGDGVGQCLPDDVTTPPKAPNKANLESKQSLESQELKSETAGAEGRKQSQSSRGQTSRKPRSRDGWPAWKGGPRPAASEAEGSELLPAAESKGANHVSRVPETG